MATPSTMMRILGELTRDGTGLGDASNNRQPNEAMQIIYGLAEMIAATHDVALESDEAWQFDLLHGHLRDCLDYAVTLGSHYADNKCVADVSRRVHVPPKWIVAAYRWTDCATPRAHDNPLLELLLPPITAFVLDGTEQLAERRGEWQAVSLAALLIAFHLGRFHAKKQLSQWLVDRQVDLGTP